MPSSLRRRAKSLFFTFKAGVPYEVDSSASGSFPAILCTVVQVATEKTYGAGVTRRYVDLSHTVVHGEVTYPGLPAPVISDGDPAHSFVATRLADGLVAARVALVGIDSVNIDSTVGGERPVHSALLAAGVAIVEHLTNLGALPDHPVDFFAVPPKVRGMGTFPVGAFAMWEDA